MWSWHDEQGDNKIQDGEQKIFQKPEQQASMFQRGPLSADARGNLWFCGYDWAGGRAADEIWVIPMNGFNKLGNPIYNWQQARRVTSREQVKLPGGGEGQADAVQPKMAQAADDGSLYAYGHTRKEGTPQNGGLHMGGNTLMRFVLKKGADLNSAEIPLPKGPVPFGSADYVTTPVLADLQWMLVTPEVNVSLDVIPTGKKPEQSGVMIGGYPFRGGVHHYTKDGLLIGAFNSDAARFGGLKDDGQHPSGLLDFYGAVSVNRDPRDGMLDVFVEDDYNNRIFWYRADDRDIQTVSGEIVKP